MNIDHRVCSGGQDGSDEVVIRSEEGSIEGSGSFIVAHQVLPANGQSESAEGSAGALQEGLRVQRVHAWTYKFAPSLTK